MRTWACLHFRHHDNTGTTPFSPVFLLLLWMYSWMTLYCSASFGSAANRLSTAWSILGLSICCWVECSLGPSIRARLRIGYQCLWRWTRGCEVLGRLPCTWSFWRRGLYRKTPSTINFLPLLPKTGRHYMLQRQAHMDIYCSASM